MRGATDDLTKYKADAEFQSTRPMRGATGLVDAEFKGQAFQSTRPMRGATQQENQHREHSSISIHAPHAGRDFQSWLSPRSFLDFNPRAPCGARPKFTKA